MAIIPDGLRAWRGCFQWDDRIAFKGGWGIYHQFVNLISIEANTYTTDMWLPVDETLTPGKAVHNAFGLMLTPGDAWQVDLSFIIKIWMIWWSFSPRFV